MEKQTWTEISLTVDGELAEVVADVLSRYILTGVVIETTRIAYDPFTYNRPEGALRVYAYIPMDDEFEIVRQKIEEGLFYLGMIQPVPSPEYRIIEEENWMESWKQHFHPIQIGDRLLILPAWYEHTDPSRLPIRINPGMAFGTGAHPTTQLCLELLETWTPQDQPIIDVGCGSGILSVAAILLGASYALGVDLDEQSMPSANENLALNSMEDQITLALGSIENIKAGEFAIRQAPLVVANILAPILVQLLDSGMADLIAPGGHLMLSGILEDHLSVLLPAVERTGLKIVERRQQNDWVAFILAF